MSFMIRSAGPHDCAGLHRLIIAHAAFEGEEATITLDALNIILGESDIRIIVATDQEVHVGYVALTLDFSLWRARQWAHLDCLFVDQEHRGQSIGQQLLAAAKSVAQSLGADRMEWQTPTWNEAAIMFYAAQNAQSKAKMRFFTAL